MEEFGNLPWRISEPSMMDVGTNFIKEESIEQSYIFQDNFIAYTPEAEAKPKPKPSSNALKINTKKYLQQYAQHSRLNKNQHKQCLEALQLIETDRLLSTYTHKEQQIINIYNNLKCVIGEENAEFLKFAEDKWNSNLHLRTTRFIKKLNDFILEKRKQKFELVKNYPKFYANNNMIPLSKNQKCIEMIHEGCLLELGVVGKLRVPNIENNDVMYMNKLPCPTLHSNSGDILDTTKLSVSDDIHAEYLAKQTACNIVISSSSLKTIIDNFGPDFGASWDIPITVKEHIVNGDKLNVIYLDKTLPQRNTDLNVSSNFKSRKILLKRNMCGQIAHSFETPNYILDNFNAQKAKSYETNAESAKITECSSPIKSPMINSPSKYLTRSAAKKITENNSTDCDSNVENSDLAKQLINEDGEIKDDEKQMFSGEQKRKKKFIVHNNVSYRLWKLKFQDDENVLMKHCSEKKEIKLLVRSKTDAFQIGENNSFLPVNIVPKMEYQVEHGATMLTKSELLRQWTTLYFRPFSNLLRVRLAPHNNKYIKIENINLNKITYECCKHYNFNPKESLGVLFNVLSNMTNLEPGKYILHHEVKHGPFAALLKSVPESLESTLNLHDLYKDPNWSSTNTPSKWIPIDTTFILPIHVKLEMIPGLFPPQNFGNNYKKGKNKQKKKKKNKAVKVEEEISD